MIRVVFNQKGGVGKSSIVCNLAAISAQRGQRTLVVDLDEQGNSSYYLGSNIYAEGFSDSEATVAHMLKQSAATWFSSARPNQDFVRSSAFENLDLLCASPLLPAIQNELESRYKIYKLRDALQELEKNYDQIFIDTPPHFNFYSKTALIAAHRVLIPFDCDSFSRQALGQLLENLVDLKQDHNPRLEIEGIIINQFNAQARLPQTLIDELLQEQLPVCKSYLSSSIKMKESHQKAKPLIHLTKNHKLTQQYVALFDELEPAKKPASTKSGSKEMA